MTNIKTLSLKAILGLLVLSLPFIQGCDDKDEPKDTTAAAIAFKNITADMTVWNTVPISMEVSDDKAIDKVEVFIGANLITTLTEDPFETLWDSNSVTDGTHTIKIVAMDKSGNASEEEISIKVLNTLVAINIAADQLYDGDGISERGFVFLSDEDGNVIVNQEYTNGNSIVFKSADFNGEKFFLTEVLLSADESETEDLIRLWTFAEIERGKNWVLLDDRNDDEVYAGNAEIVFTNPESNTSYRVVSNGDDVTADELNLERSIRLLKSPSKLYVASDSYSDDEGPLNYNLFSDIIVGNNTIDLSQVINPLTKVVATVPEGTMYSSTEIFAYPAANDYSESYYIGYFSIGSGNSSYDIYYPGTEFPSYYTETFYETDEVYYARGSSSEIYGIPEISNDVNFSFANSSLSYTAAGEFDVLTTMFGNESETSFWSLVLPEGTDETLPVFDLPAELQSMDIPVFSAPAHYTVYDFGDIDGYEELKTFIRGSSRSIDELYYAGRDYINIEYNNLLSGGRRKSVRGSGYFDLRNSKAVRK